MKKIFLSASHSAPDEVSLLAHALELEGLEVWRSEKLVPTTDWNEEVFSAIKRCDVFVAVLYKTNPNVMLELGYALGRGKSVVLIRGGDGEIPFDIASLPVSTIDRFDARSISEAVERITRASVRSRPALPNFKTAHEMLRHMCNDEFFLDEVAAPEFEECIVTALREMGFDTQMPLRTDRGYDIEIRDVSSHETAVVEIKKQNRNSRLSVTEVQKIVGSALIARAHTAIIITAGEFTASARFFAEESPIRVVLLTIDELASMTKSDLKARFE